MTARFVSPMGAAKVVARAVDEGWSRAVCAEQEPASSPGLRCTVQLSPNVSSGKDVERLGLAARHEWVQAWHETVGAGLPGVEVLTKSVSVGRVRERLPATLVVSGLDAAIGLIEATGTPQPRTDIARARQIAGDLQVCGARLTPTTLSSVVKLADEDVAVAAGAVQWLREHDDVSGWTARELPLPNAHSKWLKKHGPLLRDLVGRDVREEVRPGVAVAHLTYVDPGYVASGKRRHDAWTTGDAHEPAYRPRVVLVVENRDCRLQFPPMEGVLVVEGGGKAAASLLADVSWIRDADLVAYWGDLDADGFAILNRFRAALATPGPDAAPAHDVVSILMDALALDRYRLLGVNHDKDGNLLRASSAHLRHLTPDETSAYYELGTSGQVDVRRVEQERLPRAEAAAALADLVARRRTTRTGQPLSPAGDVRGAVPAP